MELLCLWLTCFLGSAVVVLGIVEPSAGFSRRNDSLRAQKLFLEDYKIIPDVIDDFPTHLVQISYPSDDEGIVFGGRLFPNETFLNEEPIRTLYPIETNYTMHTLMMLDLDAPIKGQADWSPYRNWLVGNIPGNFSFAGDIISRYQPPQVPRPSGAHRIIFLVYKQKDEIEFEETLADARYDGKERRNFHLRDFVKKYDLGEPIAMNFFVATWYVYHLEESN